jgi:hypothetical protein
VIDGASLTPAGTWKFSVTDRVSDFDEYQTSFTAPVR